MVYYKVLLDSIEREKASTDYYYSEADKVILSELFKEINEYAGTNFQYLAEIEAFNIKGSGEIMARYITRFSSESVKGFMVPQLVSDKIKDCDQLILDLYLHFKASDEYISEPGVPAPAHIYARYDNAFRKLKPKRLKEELIKLAYNPRDAFYLPFTMRMLASWKIPELREVLLSYLPVPDITAQSVGICEDSNNYYPSLDYIKQGLGFTAIDGLKYYPSAEMCEIIRRYTTDSDPDIRAAANKSLKTLSKSS